MTAAEGEAETDPAGPTLTLATLNLYHWAEPGIGWRSPERVHSAESWAAKRGWLREILAEMDPDLIAFQEVVSVEALAEDCAASGHAYLSVVAEPRIREAEDGSGRRVYARPVQAVAARWPIQAAAAQPDHAVTRALGLSHDRAYRRPPVRAEIEHPRLGPVIAYACHLKSPGVGVEDALMPGDAHLPPEAPAERARWTLEALSRAHAASAIQRVFEASQLFHAASADVAAAPARPVAVLGDLNDAPQSAALATLTPLRGAALEDRDASDDDVQVLREIAQRRLLDAYRLAPRSLSDDARVPTFRSGAVLDFILVSAALHPAAPGGRVASVRHRTHARHFHTGDPAADSDHAGVSATFYFR